MGRTRARSIHTRLRSSLYRFLDLVNSGTALPYA